MQRLLGFARRQDASDARRSICARLLDGMRDLIASSVGPTDRGHDVRQDSDLPPALADPNQLELAILNLCVNARDAMPEGGALTVVGREVAIGPGCGASWRPASMSACRSSTPAVGMDAETLARAVEPFFSTKEIGRGTGSACRWCTASPRSLAAPLRADQRPGRGTRADLYLPVAEDRRWADKRGPRRPSWRSAGPFHPVDRRRGDRPHRDRGDDPRPRPRGDRSRSGAEALGKLAPGFRWMPSSPTTRCRG